jgi:hypothetical protein
MGITGCCNNRKIENFASTPLSARQQTSFSFTVWLRASRQIEGSGKERNPKKSDFWGFFSF